MADDEPYDERFKSLLQPIRDLALNWDIDVASSLEDYLDELEGITITLGEELRTAVHDPLADDAGDINFAQAALLIQVNFPLLPSSSSSPARALYLFSPIRHCLPLY